MKILLPISLSVAFKQNIHSTVLVSKYMNPLLVALFSLIKYLLPTEFKVRTVSYGGSFILLVCSLSAKCAGHKSMGINEDPYLTVRTEKTRLVRYL